MYLKKRKKKTDGRYRDEKEGGKNLSDWKKNSSKSHVVPVTGQEVFFFLFQYTK